MSAVDDSVAAYPDRKQGWLAALWADKARLRRVLMVWGVGVFVGIVGIFYLMGGRYVVSDDSYVHANKLMVSTDVSGLVRSVDVREGQQVKKGDVLFTLDPKPFEIALENAQANLASTVQDAESTRAQYRAVEGQIAAQQAQLNVNKQTFARYQALAKQNAIAAMQVDTQRAAVLSAQATLASLQQNAATQLAKLNGNPNEPAEQTPQYQKAKAAVDEAQRQLDQHRPWIFNHHLGHGVGLAPQEGPHLNPRWEDTLADGDFIAVEPGLYHEELAAGVRLEQNFLVTAAGVQLMTDWPLEL